MNDLYSKAAEWIKEHSEEFKETDSLQDILRYANFIDRNEPWPYTIMEFLYEIYTPDELIKGNIPIIASADVTNIRLPSYSDLENHPLGMRCYHNAYWLANSQVHTASYMTADGEIRTDWMNKVKSVKPIADINVYIPYGYYLLVGDVLWRSIGKNKILYFGPIYTTAFDESSLSNITYENSEIKQFIEDNKKFWIN